MPLNPPVLSLYDPDGREEGSVDPLSLQATAERLAERVYPFVTSRMSRVRFLTAMVAGTVVCEDIVHDLASDGSTPAWLVFEWHVVQALMMNRSDARAMEGWGSGIPGIRKVEAVLKKGQPLSSASYLKTPKVFGFNGIYRRLALGLRVLDDEQRLDDGAYELLRAWEKDQGLPGFLDGDSGGGDRRRDLRRAVDAAMKKGYVTQPAGWSGWAELARRFHPDLVGRRERELLLRLLFDASTRPNPLDPEATAMRGEVLQRLRQEGAPVDRKGEAPFLRATRKRASEPLRIRLDAVDAFEGLCRPLIDSFNLIRALSTGAGARVVGPSDFARSREAGLLARRVGPAAELAEAAFERAGTPQAVAPLVQRYRDIRTADSLFEEVVAHHEDAQRAKPPDGKRSWFGGDGAGVVVRPPYRLEEAPALDGSWVHDYRTASVSRFLRDLGEFGR